MTNLAPTLAVLSRRMPGRAVELRRMRIELGTCVVIQAFARCDVIARQGMDAGFAAIAQIGLRMHPTRAGSDVERINSAAAGSIVSIHHDTLEVLQFAQRLNQLSHGIFDPCLPARSGRLEQLQLRADPPAVIVGHLPVHLDCGGIAKGFAVDCAVGALRAAGCTAGLVNAGGDVRVFGALRETMLLRRADGECTPLELENAALAVSDLDALRPPPEHRGYYLRSGLPVTPRRYAAVLARDAMSADALTKCVLFGSSDLTHELLLQFGAAWVS